MGKFLLIALSVVEKNPQLGEAVVTKLLQVFVDHPTLLQDAIEAGIAKLKASAAAS